MSEKKSREPYPGAPTERGPPLTDRQESVDNIIEIPSDLRTPDASFYYRVERAEAGSTKTREIFIQECRQAQSISTWDPFMAPAVLNIEVSRSTGGA